MKYMQGLIKLGLVLLLAQMFVSCSQKSSTIPGVENSLGASSSSSTSSSASGSSSGDGEPVIVKPTQALDVRAGPLQISDSNLLIQLNGVIEANSADSIDQILWTQIGNPQAVILNPKDLQTQILLPNVKDVTQLDFRLYATNSNDVADSDIASIIVMPLLNTDVRIVSVAVNEQANTMDFLVALNEPLPFDYSVAVQTIDGTAVSNQDYEALQGTLTFEAGQTEQVASVNLVNDAGIEGHEYFTLNLFGDPIKDDESAPININAVGIILDSAELENQYPTSTPINKGVASVDQGLLENGTTGIIRAYLAWSDPSQEIRLIVEDPCGNTLSEENTSVDCEGATGLFERFSEESSEGWKNGYWTEEAAVGQYTISIIHDSADPISYDVLVYFGDQSRHFTGIIGNADTVPVFEFEFGNPDSSSSSSSSSNSTSSSASSSNSSTNSSSSSTSSSSSSTSSTSSSSSSSSSTSSSSNSSSGSSLSLTLQPVEPVLVITPEIPIRASLDVSPLDLVNFLALDILSNDDVINTVSISADSILGQGLETQLSFEQLDLPHGDYQLRLRATTESGSNAQSSSQGFTLAWPVSESQVIIETPDTSRQYGDVQIQGSVNLDSTLLLDDIQSLEGFLAYEEGEGSEPTAISLDLDGGTFFGEIPSGLFTEDGRYSFSVNLIDPLDRPVNEQVLFAYRQLSDLTLSFAPLAPNSEFIGPISIAATVDWDADFELRFSGVLRDLNVNPVIETDLGLTLDGNQLRTNIVRPEFGNYEVDFTLSDGINTDITETISIPYVETNSLSISLSAPALGAGQQQVNLYTPILAISGALGYDDSIPLTQVELRLNYGEQNWNIDLLDSEVWNFDNNSFNLSLNLDQYAGEGLYQLSVIGVQNPDIVDSASTPTIAVNYIDSTNPTVSLNNISSPVFNDINLIGTVDWDSRLPEAITSASVELYQVFENDQPRVLIEQSTAAITEGTIDTLLANELIEGGGTFEVEVEVTDIADKSGTDTIVFTYRIPNNPTVAISAQTFNSYNPIEITGQVTLDPSTTAENAVFTITDLTAENSENVTVAIIDGSFSHTVSNPGDFSVLAQVIDNNGFPGQSNTLRLEVLPPANTSTIEILTPNSSRQFENIQIHGTVSLDAALLISDIQSLVGYLIYENGEGSTTVDISLSLDGSEFFGEITTGQLIQAGRYTFGVTLIDPLDRSVNEQVTFEYRQPSPLSVSFEPLTDNSEFIDPITVIATVERDADFDLTFSGILRNLNGELSEEIELELSLEGNQLSADIERSSFGSYEVEFTVSNGVNANDTATLPTPYLEVDGLAISLQSPVLEQGQQQVDLYEPTLRVSGALTYDSLIPLTQVELQLSSEGQLWSVDVFNSDAWNVELNSFDLNLDLDQYAGEGIYEISVIAVQNPDLVDPASTPVITINHINSSNPSVSLNSIASPVFGNINVIGTVSWDSRLAQGPTPATIELYQLFDGQPRLLIQQSTTMVTDESIDTLLGENLFGSGGEYTIEVTVTDKAGKSGADSLGFTFRVPNNPTVSISAPTLSSYDPIEIAGSITVDSSATATSAILTITSLNSENSETITVSIVEGAFSHTINTPGNYSVVSLVTDSNQFQGQSNTLQLEVLPPATTSTVTIETPDSSRQFGNIQIQGAVSLDSALQLSDIQNLSGSLLYEDDEDSAVIDVSLSLDDSEYFAEIAAEQFTQAGRYTFTVTLVDPLDRTVSEQVTFEYRQPSPLSVIFDPLADNSGFINPITVTATVDWDEGFDLTFSGILRSLNDETPEEIELELTLEGNQLSANVERSNFGNYEVEFTVSDDVNIDATDTLPTPYIEVDGLAISLQSPVLEQGQQQVNVYEPTLTVSGALSYDSLIPLTQLTLLLTSDDEAWSIDILNSEAWDSDSNSFNLNLNLDEYEGEGPYRLTITAVQDPDVVDPVSTSTIPVNYINSTAPSILLNDIPLFGDINIVGSVTWDERLPEAVTSATIELYQIFAEQPRVLVQQSSATINEGILDTTLEDNIFGGGGEFAVEVTVTDIAGKSGTDSLRFIYRTPSNPTVDISAQTLSSYNPIEVVGSVILDSSATAENAVLTVTSLNSENSETITVSIVEGAFSHTINTLGNYSIVAQVIDSNQFQGQSNTLELEVLPPATTSTVTIETPDSSRQFGNIQIQGAVSLDSALLLSDIQSLSGSLLYENDEDSAVIDIPLSLDDSDYFGEVTAEQFTQAGRYTFTVTLVDPLERTVSAQVTFEYRQPSPLSVTFGSLADNSEFIDPISVTATVDWDTDFDLSFSGILRSLNDESPEEIELELTLDGDQLSAEIARSNFGNYEVEFTVSDGVNADTSDTLLTPYTEVDGLAISVQSPALEQGQQQVNWYEPNLSIVGSISFDSSIPLTQVTLLLTSDNEAWSIDILNSEAWDSESNSFNLNLNLDEYEGEGPYRLTITAVQDPDVVDPVSTSTIPVNYIDSTAPSILLNDIPLFGDINIVGSVTWDDRLPEAVTSATIDLYQVFAEQPRVLVQQSSATINEGILDTTLEDNIFGGGGEFAVEVTVTDIAGKSGTDSLRFIFNAPTNPTVDISAQSLSSHDPIDVIGSVTLDSSATAENAVLTVTSLNSESSETISIAIEEGTFSYTISAPGNYSVVALVTDSNQLQGQSNILELEVLPPTDLSTLTIETPDSSRQFGNIQIQGGVSLDSTLLLSDIESLSGSLFYEDDDNSTIIDIPLSLDGSEYFGEITAEQVTQAGRYTFTVTLVDPLERTVSEQVTFEYRQPSPLSVTLNAPVIEQGQQQVNLYDSNLTISGSISYDNAIPLTQVGLLLSKGEQTWPIDLLNSDAWDSESDSFNLSLNLDQHDYDGLYQLTITAVQDPDVIDPVSTNIEISYINTTPPAVQLNNFTSPTFGDIELSGNVSWDERLPQGITEVTAELYRIIDGSVLGSLLQQVTVSVTDGVFNHAFVSDLFADGNDFIIQVNATDVAEKSSTDSSQFIYQEPSSPLVQLSAPTTSSFDPIEILGVVEIDPSATVNSATLVILSLNDDPDQAEPSQRIAVDIVEGSFTYLLSTPGNYSVTAEVTDSNQRIGESNALSLDIQQRTVEISVISPNLQNADGDYVATPNLRLDGILTPTPGDTVIDGFALEVLQDNVWQTLQTYTPTQVELVNNQFLISQQLNVDMINLNQPYSIRVRVDFDNNQSATSVPMGLLFRQLQPLQIQLDSPELDPDGDGVTYIDSAQVNGQFLSDPLYPETLTAVLIVVRDQGELPVALDLSLDGNTFSSDPISAGNYRIEITLQDSLNRSTTVTRAFQVVNSAGFTIEWQEPVSEGDYLAEQSQLNLTGSIVSEQGFDIQELSINLSQNGDPLETIPVLRGGELVDPTTAFWSVEGNTFSGTILLDNYINAGEEVTVSAIASDGIRNSSTNDMTVQYQPLTPATLTLRQPSETDFYFDVPLTGILTWDGAAGDPILNAEIRFNGDLIQAPLTWILDGSDFDLSIPRDAFDSDGQYQITAWLQSSVIEGYSSEDQIRNITINTAQELSIVLDSPSVSEGPLHLNSQNDNASLIGTASWDDQFPIEQLLLHVDGPQVSTANITPRLLDDGTYEVFLVMNNPTGTDRPSGIYNVYLELIDEAGRSVNSRAVQVNYTQQLNIQLAHATPSENIQYDLNNPPVLSGFAFNADTEQNVNFDFVRLYITDAAGNRTSVARDITDCYPVNGCDMAITNLQEVNYREIEWSAAGVQGSQNIIFSYTSLDELAVVLTSLGEADSPLTLNSGSDQIRLEGRVQRDAQYPIEQILLYAQGPQNSTYAGSLPEGNTFSLSLIMNNPTGTDSPSGLYTFYVEVRDAAGRRAQTRTFQVNYTQFDVEFVPTQPSTAETASFTSINRPVISGYAINAGTQQRIPFGNVTLFRNDATGARVSSVNITACYDAEEGCSDSGAVDGINYREIEWSAGGSRGVHSFVYRYSTITIGIGDIVIQ